MPKYYFGPAGKPVDYKGNMIGVPQFLHEIGLNALEYQAVRGVKISEDKARKLGEEAKKHNVLLSLHAPYFINLGSPKDATVQASIKRLMNSVRAAHWMNAYIVVFHPGYYKDTTPEEALKRSIKALKEVEEYRRSLGAENVWLGPETTGKVTQLGSLEENIAICREIDRCKPVIDWAHLHARSLGSYIVDISHVIEVIELVEKELGTQAVKPLHMHFSRIEYGKGGEREHHTLAEEEYGPEFKIICKGVVETGIDAVFISESPILERDALVMKKICTELCGVECIVD